MKQLSSIRFNVSGIDYNVKVEDVTPETSLNTYLRETLHLTGTKRMCLEGGCGTCIVAVEEVKPNGEKRVFAVNSCLVSILSCHGWKIYSTEGIGNRLNGFHKIQHLLADNNGTQCGFCSPGMVMNMYALHESGPKTKAQIENSFGGNLCRCTGYRPIMEAFYNLASDKENIEDIEDIDSVFKKCPRNYSGSEVEKEGFSLKIGKATWMKVYYLKDILEILRTSEDEKYMLVAGNTAQGVVWPTSFPEIYIDVTNVEQLLGHTLSGNTLTLGANVSLTTTMDIFNETSKNFPNFSYLELVANHIDLVANVPVRNIGTLAGNLMLKHQNQRFQSDIFLILETVNAVLVIIDVEDNELRKSPKEFLAIDMKKKVMKEIVFRGYDPKKYYYRSFKIMNRSQNTHAIVNAGFLFKLSTEGLVKSANIVYGAISNNFIHAAATEALLIGLNLFDNNTLQKAFGSLSQEINPDLDPPDPGPECRKQLAINLFYKFVLSIAPPSKLSLKNKSGGSILSRPVASGMQEFSTSKDQYPLTEPVIKLEALAQTSGQAQYIIDKPDLPYQLHACFVTAETTPGSVILAIDKTRAMASEDIVAFYSAKDIPGINSVTALSFGMPAEELFAIKHIDVTVKRLGGSYGGKIVRGNYVAAATALAAVKLQKPVRMWLPYHMNTSIIGKRLPLYAKYEIGVNEKGSIQNMSTELYSDLGAGLGIENVNETLMDCFENGYNFDKWTYDTFLVRTDTCNNTYTRSPGTLEGLACIESIMEEIAYSLDLDPLDVRIANLDRKKYPKILEFINDMKAKDNLSQRISAIKEYNKANRWKKKGISVTTMKWTMSLLGSYTTLVSIYYQNGGVAISHGGVEMGQGINTKVAQVCAYKFGIPISLISIKPTTNLTSPNSFTTGGSWTSEAICYSVMLACDRLLKRMEPVKKQNPTAPWDQLVKLSHLANINLSANGFSYRDNKAIQDYPIFGVCAAEVEVDILTGQKVINRVDIIEDVGQSMSPLVDVGQVEGAFVMGIGYHLTEELIMSQDGELLNNRTWNYTPPGVKDIPVDFRITFPPNNPNPLGVLKSKATAEPPICLSVAVPLAIRNALASARSDANNTKPKWVPFNGPTTVEYILLNTLNDYRQYTL